MNYTLSKKKIKLLLIIIYILCLISGLTFIFLPIIISGLFIKFYIIINPDINKYINNLINFYITSFIVNLSISILCILTIIFLR